jgi:enamine deaminase RidA (YjgF/YER057c/UK114 family)
LTRRKKTTSGGKYEEIVGYSRAIKVGKQIFVSGTGSVDPTRPSAGKEEALLQTSEALKTIEESLKQLGGSLADVVRTRVFVKSGVDWMLVAKAHKKAFGEIKPASTWLVSDFLDPHILVEIEADAVLD